MKILIIGASGYVGGRLSYLLAKDGNEITALCHRNKPDDADWNSKMAKVLIADITSESQVSDITNIEYDIAIHLVSLDHNDSKKSPSYVNSINVLPVWNLLESFKVKKTLKKFIYFSTVHVYGDLPEGSVDESYAPSPNTPYGLTHFMSESICNMFNNSSEIQCVNIRMTNSYGSPYFKDNSCWWLVVNDLCKSAYVDKKIVLQSDGSALRDFVHYNDIFQAINAIISISICNDNTFHLSSGQTITIFNLAEKVKEVYKKRYGSDIPIILPENTRNSKGLKYYTINNKKLNNIGFEISITIEEGINELFTYIEKNAK
ncbi:nucleoside-diphosphate-sugar epimerase [Lutibacter sp. Hel_I_33_5]|uniref:NAD-dependent epimerase/dehydratase family protein n=1 Tax=Lutibacter sp. Hel_I_33_5 TaxID=1566289 RepID=UPI0011A6431A|nr:NAD(P)-dependent oxidoreductase [Lutibacter sp. Hel_I_33_5]TVZ55490.1 nucleoside-diphosphate-sugar epimerase [Lutibacter sp. Hel_I_33_5]